MIVASTPLVPTPRDVALSPAVAVSIDFALSLSDTAALPGGSTPHTLTLTLEPGNDLLFEPENAKQVDRPKTISSAPTPFIFKGRVKGTGAGLLSFKVSLLDDGGQMVAFCLVGLL